MMQLPLALAMAAAPATAAAQTPDARAEACVNLAASDAPAAEREAYAWRQTGGGFRARQCEGVALANQERWPQAATAFEDAAGDAVTVSDNRASGFWAQAGNAWLAAGESAKALVALDRALADKSLKGLLRGEAELDKARAHVAAGDQSAARAALDRALSDAADDPLAWLLSATLARRTGDLSRARADIGQALRRAADDPSVQLEAGNVAATAGDVEAAKKAWAEVVRLRPDSPQGKAAEVALAQFD